MAFKHFYAVIMAGGGGTRLWPLSRADHPKQMLALGGKRTLFQQAVDRLEGIFPYERILVVTTLRQAEALQKEIPGIPSGNYLLEPAARGTASVVALAAGVLSLRDPDAVMAILTADHIIGNIPLFQTTLKACHSAAQEGELVTIGIPPEFPSSGYGYLQLGEKVEEHAGMPAFKVAKFQEKPDLETAKAYLAAGGHLWNSGMFFWRTDRILAEFERQMPALRSQIDEICRDWSTDRRERTFETVWSAVIPQTIDFGIMEGARDVVVFPAEGLGWSDVGSWDSLFDVIPSDENGNIILTQAEILGAPEDSLFHEEDHDKIIAAIGIRNMIVVDTPDALLICPRGDSQKIRELVIKLKETGKQRYL